MGMTINTNLMAMKAHRNNEISTNLLQKSMEKLSTGQRINHAGDDVAGLGISERMRAQIRGLSQAQKNGQDAISLLQTAEGALSSTTDILQRINELGVQASNATVSTEEINNIQKEVDQLLEEIDKFSSATTFNNKSLLNGTGNFKFTVGANGESIDAVLGKMDTTTLGTPGATLNSFKDGGANRLTTNSDATKLITSTQEALAQISSQRSYIGAKQNRLEFRLNSLSSEELNLTTAESRIRDVDTAKEMMKLSKQQILSQVSQSMFSQSLQNAQQVLSLLR